MGWLPKHSTFLHTLQDSLQQGASDRVAAGLPGSIPDHLLAVVAVLVALCLVLASVALGWAMVWHTTLHKIGIFRDLLGLNRARKAEQKREAQRKIAKIKEQFARAAAAPGQPEHSKAA
mmetsp:Transcript_40054/g.88945  ORF Transcript_40054/g.88945 Transcript_40054/m.88945 type:complete len:119 (+) Transcript_40054:147-503(+)|eukprot:CAMPEP_0202902916 /NCGR_PEP_ID=MMETSP1392-20130828/18768_1 /ASSEMBLY_ACC=CAM_ASM_000868 /TAXON_ID=225041 /ORGANISM="Chlamydomonas chlamydogama, Strain SAG 11-48b" /LENGTH=118 /DNA_ID=CAMNT_0049589777 /DNA_START=74 /DNA_END=430 /DNA_ORIENTATION=-